MDTNFEFDGVRLAGKYSRHGDRIVGGVWLPSGAEIGYEVYRDGHSNLYDHGSAAPPADQAVIDRLFPLTPDRFPYVVGGVPKVFRRASPALQAAAWAAVPAPAVPVEDAPVVPALAEIAAACEAEGTALAVAAAFGAECLECGAVYPPEKAHLVDAGGMGCYRCNH
jgi:hypothetical protein